MGSFLLFAFFFAGTLGFVVSLILLFASKAESFSARMLAAFLLSFSFFAIYFGLQTTSFFLRAPHLWKAFVGVSFLYMPISYIYVRSAVKQSYRFEKWDFLLLIPAIAFTASYIPVYIKPASVKIAYIEEVARHPEYLSMEPYSLFPPWSGFAVRVLLGIGCVIGQFHQLRLWKQKAKKGLSQEPQNRDMYRWLLNFTMLIGLFYVLVSIQFIFRDQFGKSIGPITLYTIVGTILFVCFWLLFKPTILYGMQGWVNHQDLSVTPAAAEIPVFQEFLEEKKKSYLSAEQGAAMKTVFEKHMQEQRPFLKPGYSIAQLSQELSLPSYQLSGFINQEYAKNFNELINEYRVHHLINHMKDSHGLSQFTLEAVGREVGFNSRAAFIAAVRKVTGKTPSEVLGRRIRETPEKV